MSKKLLPLLRVTLDRIIGGGQTIGTLESGKKALVWGGLPGETVEIQVTKRKSSFVEGVVTDIVSASNERVTPRDPGSYLSTSPWQIMSFATEQHYKSALVEEAFELHDIVLPQQIQMWSDGIEYEYRNKVEYSFWYDLDTERLSLAFFRRGTHGKISINSTSLASPIITEVSQVIVRALDELKIDGRNLKTVIIRSNRQNQVAWQLYVKNEEIDAEAIIHSIQHPAIIRGEVIYSNPKSPASVITKRLVEKGDGILTDSVLDIPFSYVTEGFFQINIPVYEQALRDMQSWLDGKRRVIDLYSGVGTIGLTIGGDAVTLVESNEAAVNEMRRNCENLGKENATVVLAPSEKALDYIAGDATIIVDPPRAGLHEDVVNRLLEQKPQRILYLSCNPVTQARDVSRLAEAYGIRWHQGYNFFPHTPHIEHLVILDLKQ